MAAITTIKSGNIDESQNPIFMATGNTTTGNQSSADGITWAARTLPSAIAWTGLSYGMGLAVAVGTGAAGVTTSIDGTTWVARTMPSAAVWYAVTCSGSRFVAVANGSTSAAYSDDGFNWIASTMSVSGNWKSIAYGNGKFVAINNVSGSNSLITCTSTDGIAWSNQTAAVTSTGTWTSITFGNGKFVAVCSGGTVAAESTDGVAWTARTLPASKLWNSVCYGPSGFFAIPSDAANTAAAFSANGTTWTAVVMPASVAWVACAYGYGRYGAVSVNTTSAATSFDGLVWTARTQVSAAYVACAYFPITWNSGDTLSIQNNATVTVNTDQKKFWSAITIVNGTLAIANTGTTLGSAVTFSMGRLSGTTAAAITPSSGLGKVTVNGNWISLATGSGVAAQSVTTPYTDYIPAVWVETSAGSGNYEMWLNATGAYGSSNEVFNEGLNAVSSGVRGKFFKQVSNGSDADTLILAAGAGIIGTRIVTVTSTANLVPGASVAGTGIAASNVVQKIISATQFEVAIVHTATFSAQSITAYNPYRSQLTNQIIFGNGTNGALVPTGANIRIPNILITDLSPGNVQTASAVLGTKISLLNGGILQANICLFDESYNDFTQANKVTLNNVGFSIPFLITECYQFTASNLAFPRQPVRRYFTTFWNARDIRATAVLTWSYISGASITNFKMVNDQGQAYISSAPNATAPGAHIGLSQTDKMVMTNADFFTLNPARAYSSMGISCTLGVTNGEFTNMGFYGCQPMNFQVSSGNKVTNVKHSSDMFNGVTYMPNNTAFRIYKDPSTGNILADNTTYYLKVRTFRTWNDRSQYFESNVQSFTTQNGDKNLMVPKISAISSAASTVKLDWERKSPEATIAIYEIFRGTTPGFSKTGATRLTNITAAATITYNDATATNGNTYYYAMRKHSFQYATITNSAGTIGLTTITSSQNMGTALGNTGNVATGYTGSNKIYFAPGYTALTTMGVGMQLGHANITPGTTIVSIDEVNEVTLSASLLGDITNGTLTIGVGVGMAVYGTGVAVGAKVATIAANGLSITVDAIHTGAVSGTLTFTDFEESNEITVVSQGVTKTCANVLLQSNTLATTWVATTITPLAAAAVGVHDTNLGTAAVLSASKLTLTSTTGNVTQSPATTIASAYKFGVWLRTDLTVAQKAGVSGTITLGLTTTNFTVTDKWQYFEAVYTAIATTTAVKITVNDVSGNYIFVSGAHVTLVASATTLAGMPIATTTTAVTLNPAAQEITAAYAYSRSASGFTGNQGVEVTIAANPAGTLWSELYLGTTSNFVPSQLNMVGSSQASTANLFNFNNGSSNNVIDGFTLEGNGGISGGVTALALTSASSNNKFLNFTINAPTWYIGQIATINTLSNNNFFHNWKILGLRSNSNLDLFATSNNCTGQLVQNVVVDRAPDLLSNVQSLNTVVKNMTTGSVAPAGTGTTYVLGATDSVAVTGAAQYDYSFLELNFSSNKGALFLRFNASAKVAKPYVITGNCYFDNAGKLFFNNVGDSIEYTWPHKILGVTGFQRKRVKAIGTDLGISADILQGLYKEYALDTGSGYGAYKEMTADNLANEVVSANSGFYMKIKLTALFSFKYPAITNSYVVGEVVRGSTSLATGTVVADYRATATTGTCVLSGVAGVFVPGENVVRNSDAQARTTTTAVVSGADQQFNSPFFTSNINGLQIPTFVDETVKYPAGIGTIKVNGLVTGSRMKATKVSDGTVLFNGAETAGVISFDTDYFGSINVEVRKASSTPYYIPWVTQVTSVSGQTVSAMALQQLDE